MSNWIEHLEELASVETDVKKKVAFQSSAKLIKELAKGGTELRAELAALKQSIPKLRANAIRDMLANLNKSGTFKWEHRDAIIEDTINEYANKIEDGS